MNRRIIIAGALAGLLSGSPAMAQTNQGSSPLTGPQGGTNNAFMQFTGPDTSVKTFTLPNASDTIATLGAIQTFSAAKTFNSAKLLLAGSSSGAGTLNAPAAASTFVWTLPGATDTLVGRDTTDTLTNKTLTSPAISGPTVTGTADVQQALTLSGDITPTQLSANTNDWAPTGFSTASAVRLSTDASRNITGLAGGADGRIIILHNVGSFDAVLKNQDANSTAANRFLFGGDVTLLADYSVTLRYDATTSRWRAITTASAGGGGGGTVTSAAIAAGAGISVSGTCTITTSGTCTVAKGSGMVLLETLTPSAVSTVDTSVSFAAYPTIVFVVHNLKSSAGIPLMRVNTGSVQTANYISGASYLSTGGVSSWGTGATNTTGMILGANNVTSTDGMSGTLKLHNPSQGSFRKMLEGNIVVFNGAGALQWNTIYGMWDGSSADVTGARFLSTSGTITGTIKVYGLF